MERRGVVALALVIVLLVAGHLGTVECQLSASFYATSCPLAGTIVKGIVGSAVAQSPIVGPSLLRLAAHDCFVSGCDASIMLVDNGYSPPVERDVSENLSLQKSGFDVINQVKQAIEGTCPGVVSCADIITMASQESVSSMGGPAWTVLLGRRDGLTSTASSVSGRLPLATMTVAQLNGVFGAIGLTPKDVVALSGAHTVGLAHCAEFVQRLYGFNTTSGSDPSLAPNYAATLRTLCPNGNFASGSAQSLDPLTPTKFDNAYYQTLQIGEGLLFSDQELYVDSSTTALVTTYANNQAQFFSDFAASMIAMSTAGVLTGTQGEIRLNCSVVNSAVGPPAPVVPAPVVPAPVIPAPVVPAPVIPAPVVPAPVVPAPVIPPPVVPAPVIPPPVVPAPVIPPPVVPAPVIPQPPAPVVPAPVAVPPPAPVTRPPAPVVPAPVVPAPVVLPPPAPVLPPPTPTLPPAPVKPTPSPPKPPSPPSGGRRRSQ